MKVILMPRKPTQGDEPKNPLNVVRLPDKKGPTNVKHVPTETSRLLVMTGKLSGYTHEQLADMLHIDRKTLALRYPDELATGKERMLVKVANNLFTIATQSRDLKAAITASIFILKTQGGWRENGPAKTEEGDRKKVVVSLNIGDKEPKTA
jgi:hypothetical protein